MNLEHFSGLKQEQADLLLKKNGANELPSQRRKNGWALLLSVCSEPMLILLIASGTIYSFLGEFSDALILLSSVFVIIGITFYQERKTERTLEALRDLSSPRAIVIRDGEQKRIAGKEVVQGDIIVLLEGDRVPADAIMLACEHVTIDESLLTGESMPVRKMVRENATEEGMGHPGGDDLPYVYSGSLIVSGRGVAKVVRTGIRTEIGKIGKSLGEIKEEKTPLHKETGKIVRSVAAIGIFLCLLIVAAYFLLRDDLIQGLLTGLTLGMAILPEEFPVVLIVFLTIGAWRISKRHVLTRRSAAIETLGSATVLCSDKTGTITLNKMELSYLYAGETFYEIGNASITDIPKQKKELLRYGVLASREDPFDPIEREILRTADTHLTDDDRMQGRLKLEKEYPLTPALLAVTQAWKSDDDGYLVAAKGAPEAISRLCRMSDAEEKQLMERVKEMSEKGLRILGVAKSSVRNETLPEEAMEFSFNFVGLLGFIDPPRASVSKSVQEAQLAGIRVIMITGDYPGTAMFISKQIGIVNSEACLTGEEIERMDHQELRERIKTINVFARVIPEQKLNIVHALKANHEIVAMTGDGVNDAPALKAAHIGIAMGERGTDVAREASSLVLLNDDFSSIVSAIRLGRRIYDNIQHAMSYVLTVHVPIAGISILPIFFGLPIVLLPAHIVFLEFLIDPACSIVFESKKEERGIMRRPPRDPHAKLFGMQTVMIALVQGLGSLAASFGLYYYSFKTTGNESVARSFAFSTLVLSNVMLIISNLSWKESIFQTLRSQNRALMITVSGAIVALMAVLYIPALARLFRLAPLPMMDLLLIGAVVIASISWFEVVKIFKPK